MKKRIHVLCKLGVVAIGFSMMGANCQGTAPACPEGASCIAAQPMLPSSSVYTENCGGNGGLGGDNLNAPVGTGYVGWDHNTYGMRLGDRGLCDRAEYYYRTAMFFNQKLLTDFVNAHGLLKATLRFVVPSNLMGEPIPAQSSYQRTCVAELGLATDQDWFGEDPSDNRPTPYNALLELPTQAPYNQNGIQLSTDSGSGGVLEDIDVTTTVRSWVLNMLPNNGIVLAGNNETGFVDDGACESTVQYMQLILYPFR